MDDRMKCYADQNYCNASVPNPFANAPELVGLGLYSATTTRSQAILPYPQFTGVTQASMPIGRQSGDLLEVLAFLALVGLPGDQALIGLFQIAAEGLDLVYRQQQHVG